MNDYAARGDAMKNGCMELLDKINSYLSVEITEGELRVWAAEKYLDNLKGGFLYIENLMMHRFYKCLASLGAKVEDDFDEPRASFDEIMRIKRILSGKENITFTISLMMQKWMYTEAFEFGERLYELYSQLQKDVDCGENISGKSVYYADLIAEMRSESNQQKRTVVDLIHDCIICLLKGSLLAGSREDFFDTRLCIGGNKYIAEEAAEKISSLLRCAMGEKEITCVVSFVDGDGSLSLLL